MPNKNVLLLLDSDARGGDRYEDEDAQYEGEREYSDSDSPSPRYVVEEMGVQFSYYTVFIPLAEQQIATMIVRAPLNLA